MNGNGRAVGGIPLQTIIAIGVIVAGGLGAFFELKGDVRVMAERHARTQEATDNTLKDIRRDLREIKSALGLAPGNRLDRFDGGNGRSLP